MSKAKAKAPAKDEKKQTSKRKWRDLSQDEKEAFEPRIKELLKKKEPWKKWSKHEQRAFHFHDGVPGIDARPLEPGLPALSEDEKKGVRKWVDGIRAKMDWDQSDDNPYCGIVDHDFNTGSNLDYLEHWAKEAGVPPRQAKKAKKSAASDAATAIK